MDRMKIVRLLTICLVMVCAAGCASTLSMMARAGKGGFTVSPIYPATEIDGVVLYGSIFKSKSSGPSFDFCSGIILWVPFALIDFAPSLATDTLLLPYDIYHFVRLPSSNKGDSKATQHTTNTANQASVAIGAKTAPQPQR
jgi:hypothetical protein